MPLETTELMATLDWDSLAQKVMEEGEISGDRGNKFIDIGFASGMNQE